MAALLMTALLYPRLLKLLVQDNKHSILQCCCAGKRRREAAWSHETSHQLADFEDRLPSLLASWSIEKERQQWTQLPKHAC